MRIVLAAALAAAPLPGPAVAIGAEVVRYQTDAAFEDVAFDLRMAIEGRGFVVDAVSHVGAMLARTGADVGSEAPLFRHADVYQFCSASLSRAVMEADILNIAHCPYGVFAYEAEAEPGVVQVGYRRMPEGPMQAVEAVLDAIAREATGR